MPSLEAGTDGVPAGLGGGWGDPDRTSAETKALRVFGLGGDEASGASETIEGSGTAAVSVEAALGAAVSLPAAVALTAAGSLGAAGLRRRRRPLPERVGSGGAWPLPDGAEVPSGERSA